MNMHVSPLSIGVVGTTPVMDPQQVTAAMKAAAGRIAPLWPLRSFVAVNPFLGLADRSLSEAATLLAKAGGARLTHPLSFYASRIAAGDIADGDIAGALAQCPRGVQTPDTVEAFKATVATTVDIDLPALPTVANTAAKLTAKDWPSFVNDRVSQWASHHFDQGQALWQSPTRALSLYAAWRMEAATDMTPDIMGLRQFRTVVRTLPATAHDAIVACVAALGLTAEDLPDYFHRLLFSLGGWSSYVRYLGWEKEVEGETVDGLIELLAIRISWEHGLLSSLARPDIAAAWHRDLASAQEAHATPEASLQHHLRQTAHLAYERSERRKLFACLPTKPASDHTARVQAVFCIDVRSEVFRRALEAVSPEIETLGFAGFFGAPIAYAPINQAGIRAQAPVLLRPAYIVRETSRLAERQAVTEKFAKSWKGFQQQAISSFGFVETAGAAYGLKLLSAALGIRKQVAKAKAHATHDHGLCLDEIPVEARLAMAENALRGMSLTGNFAPLVLLVGHGSSSLNNPHASGLSCGACGGHSGEVNARVMATILNDPNIRSELSARGIDIPAETCFLAALHDTTTDEVTLFDTGTRPAPAASEVNWIAACLRTAGARARAERALRLPGNCDPKTRARDWSQARPEWGLAGCAAFIAAPRQLTKGADFKGRVFLHSYEWKDDHDFKVLELILTAPMVVASWISLQYFASTVDNKNFGSGNKALHNVVGTFGVLEGNTGILRTGLPLQSIHDGERFVHDPVRLSVVIAAPQDAISAVVARHQHVRDLLDNGWVHLLTMDDNGSLSGRYTGNLTWSTLVDDNTHQHQFGCEFQGGWSDSDPSDLRRRGQEVM